MRQRALVLPWPESNYGASGRSFLNYGYFEGGGARAREPFEAFDRRVFLRPFAYLTCPKEGWRGILLEPAAACDTILSLRPLFLSH